MDRAAVLKPAVEARRASFWPDCSTELQHDAKALRSRASFSNLLTKLASAPGENLDGVEEHFSSLSCSKRCLT